MFELPEDLPQVPFDGAGAAEQLRPDLDVRQAVSSRPRVLDLLRSQGLLDIDRAPPNGRAGGEQLSPGSLREGPWCHPAERVVGDGELLRGPPSDGLLRRLIMSPQSTATGRRQRLESPRLHQGTEECRWLGRPTRFTVVPRSMEGVLLGDDSYSCRETRAVTYRIVKPKPEH